jgi:hypothetical protein
MFIPKRMSLVSIRLVTIVSAPCQREPNREIGRYRDLSRKSRPLISTFPFRSTGADAASAGQWSRTWFAGGSTPPSTHGPEGKAGVTGVTAAPLAPLVGGGPITDISAAIQADRQFLALSDDAVRLHPALDAVAAAQGAPDPLDSRTLERFPAPFDFL